MIKSIWKSAAVIALAIAAMGLGANLRAAEAPRAHAMRTPNGGIQPRAMVDASGATHLIYFQGDPKGGDIFYVRAPSGGLEFSKPVRVNSQPGSAIAAGSVRGAHLALGKNGRPHVAWMGSQSAKPRLNPHSAPMLYSRLDDDGSAFEPQRNVIQQRAGLDGGGSIAADGSGKVYVVWHAPGVDGHGEENRRVWVARSTDEGATFSTERPADSNKKGVCPCCGIRAFAPPGGPLLVAYRTSVFKTNRDMTLLSLADGGTEFESLTMDKWKISQCVVSTSSFSQSGGRLLAAWETEDQVFWGEIDSAGSQLSAPVAAPGNANKRKHPSVMGIEGGATAMAWAEVRGWGKPGAAAWQIFDAEGRPIPGAHGRRNDMPAWSFPAVTDAGDGGIAIFY